MRNDDLSQSSNHLQANDDYDVIPTGSASSATGNAITGRGTVSGASGADHAVGAHVTAITGSGGDGASAMEAAGRYGSIKIDAQGNYTYMRKAGSPDNVEDVFTYTLADKAGSVDSARLIIRIDGEEQEAVKADAQRIVAGNEVITLPAGVELSDIRVVGRDLVITLPDGSQMVIVDGAVFVPQLALGDVELPADTLASLLIDSEPRPAAGPPQSSGGNFGEDVAPLDPGVPLGDLLPPTELDYTPPEFEEPYIPEEDEDEPDFPPEIFIQPDGQPASIEATDEVDEAALNSPPNDHEGSQSESSAETVSGTIVFSSPDGVDTITISINGSNYVIYGPGAVSTIPGDYGTLEITDVDIAGGTASYTYTLNDNVDHDSDTTPWEDFSVSLVDEDGDVATATLRINIADDIPEAMADVDSVTEDGALVADGNVFTGSGGADANGTDGVADVEGADGANVVSFRFGEAAGTLGGAGLSGNYGSLTLTAGGVYVYTLNNEDPDVQALGAGETATETYHYTIQDNDGDISETTLTITIVGTNDRPVLVSGSTAVTEEAFVAPEDNAGNPDGVGNPTDTASSASAGGTLSISDADGDAMTVTLGIPAGSYYSHGSLISWTLSDGGHTLTGSANGGSVIVVTINNGGTYTVNLLEQFDHPVAGTTPANGEDIVSLVVPVTANDGTVSANGTLTIAVEDDSPIVTGETSLGVGVDLDESDSGTPVLSPAGAISATSAGAIISAAVAYGGDGPGADPAYTITLNGAVEGMVDSGLVTADGNHPITLVQVDSTHIQGVFNNGSDQVAFTVTINPNGSITVTQNYALEHSDDGSSAVSHNDTNSPLTLAGLITAHVIYEDFDHDTVEASGNIGQLIRFFDDGPSVSVGVQLPTGQALDGLALVTTDNGTEGPGSTMDSTTANFGGAFSISADGGADGLASSGLSFDLNLVGAGDGPVDSGLTSHGQIVYLFQLNANTVIATTSNVAVGAGDPSIVFTLSTTDAGAVTLTQYQQVDHDPEVPSGSPFADQFAVLGNDLIELVATGTATDNDGDFATDSEALDLGGLVRFADDGPGISAAPQPNAILVVDESLPGTVGAETEPAGTLGRVSAAINTLIVVTDTQVSADAPTTYEHALVLGTPSGGLVASGLMTSAGNLPIYLYVQGDGSVVGSTATDGVINAGNTVFTIAISGDDVVLTQYQAIEHGDAPNNYNELSPVMTGGALNIQVTATDYDGDTSVATVDLGSLIRFNDDGPTAEVTVNGLPTDPAALAAFQLVTGDNGTEGDGSTTDSTTANFGDLFGIVADGGSDGAASSVLSFDLNLVGDGDGPVDSGLTSHGQVVYLFQINANTVIATTSNVAVGAGDPSVVFTLSTTDGGAVTLTQLQQVDHDPEVPSGSPFADQFEVLGSGLVQVVATATVTDNDGDIATDTEVLDLGGLVRFADDGPVIQASLVQGAALHIDESLPGTDGADTDAAGLGQVSVALASIVTFSETVPSADQPTVATGYALSVGPVGSNGLVDSGLFHSVPGTPDQPIYLYQQLDGSVVGSTALSAAGVDGSNTVFTVAIVGGNVVMTQYQAIVNPTAGGPGAAHDENSANIANGALLLTVTATDYDGDTASSSVNLGSIVSFGDDGPVASDRTLPGTQPENANVVVDVTADIDAGSDGFDRVDNYSTSGAGTLSYNSVTQEFTYDPADGESGTVTITYRVYDNDGDWDEATISFELSDSAPVAIDVTAKLDDDGLLTGNAASTAGDIDANAGEVGAGTASEAIWTGQLGVSSGGADTPLTYSLAGMVGPGVVGAENVNYTWNAVNNTLTATTVGGTRPGTVLFTTQITNVNDGSYTITLVNPIMHATQTAPGDETSAPNVVLTYTVSDSDLPADTDTGTITITFNDDAPTAALALKGGAFLVVDETDGVTANGFETDAPGGNLGVATMTAADLFVNTSVYGADGAAASGAAVYSLQINGLTAAGSSLATTMVTSNGNLPITLYLMADGSIVGSTAGSYGAVAAGNTVFSVSIAANGTTTLTQFQAIEHNDAPNNYDENTTVGGLPVNGIQVALAVKDGDNDTSKAVVDLGSRIQFEDDGPNAGADPTGKPVLALDESAAGTDTPGGTAPVGDRTESVDIASYFAAAIYGSDSAGTTTNALVLNGGPLASGLFALDPTDTLLDGDGIGQGAAIMLEQHGNQIWGVAGGQTYFTIDLTGTTLTFTQAANLNIWHPNTGTLDETASLSLAANTITIVHTVTDSDGDKDTAVLDLSTGVFSIQDDGPKANAGSVMGAVGEDALADGNPDAGDTKTTSTGAMSLAGLFSFGTDGAGDVRIDPTAIAAQLTAQGLASGGVALKYHVSADGHTLTAYTGASVGIGNVFTLTLSGTNATFVLLDQIDHLGSNLSGSGDDQIKTIDFSGIIRAYDADGDSVGLNADSFKVTVEDDLPGQAAGVVTAHVDEDELPAGITDGDGQNTIATGSLSALASVGADQPGTFSFDLTGATLPAMTSGGLAVNYSIVGGVLIGHTGADPNILASRVFTVTLSGTNNSDFSVALLKPIDHLGAGLSGSGDNEVKLVDFSSMITVTDKDNDAVKLDAGSFRIEFEDDIPTTFTPQAAVTTNNAAGLFNGSLDFGDIDGLTDNFGADGGKAVFVAAGLPTTLKSGGVALSYTISADGQTLTATQGPGGATVFTATINGSSYTLDVVLPIDSLTNVQFTDANYDFYGGNKAWFGIVPNGQNGAGAVDDDSKDVLITPIGGPSINSSGILGGVDTGQSVGSGEGFRIDYVVDLRGTLPNNYTDGQDSSVNGHIFDTHWTTNGASVSFRQSTGTQLRVQAFDDTDADTVVGDGSLDTITGIVLSYNGVSSTVLAPTNAWQDVTVAGHLFSYKLDADGKSVLIDHVAGATGNSGPPETTISIFTSNGYTSLEFEYVSGADIKFSGFGAAVPNTDPVIFNIPVKIVDGDLDETAVVNIPVTLNSPAPPVVLDTNHDGYVSFLGMDAGVLYDVNGDGHLDATAWAASGDSILFRDSDGNGTVSGASEFVFGGNGVTDLEALHAMYGAQLDASDADFAMFGLWNDANSNGIVDEGEISTLAEAGITSISLVSDGVGSSEAGGDVAVSGMADFTYLDDDGHFANGKLADASFGYRALSAEDEQRLAANATNANLLAIAAAALGLADAAAAESGDAARPATEAPASVEPNIAPTANLDSVDEPAVAPLVANDELDVAPVASDSGHRLAVVEDESDIAIDDAAASDDAADVAPANDTGPAIEMTPLPDIAPLAVVGEAIAPDEGGRHNAVVSSELIEQPDSAIDQLLAKLGGGDAIESLAQVQSGGHAVQGWDMADFGHLPAAVMEHIGGEAVLLHPDAVQPVMHG